jgi:hypothetical protein
MQAKNKFPHIVYKYRNWSEDNHKNILLKNELFFTSPKDFNDPFDCRVPLNLSLLNTDDKINAYLEKKRVHHNEDAIKNLEYRLRNELPKLQESWEELYGEGVSNYYGVLSLSKRWNSILMWSHYADHHKGYCVGFWEENLRNSIEVSAGPVFYPPNNDYPQIDPLYDEDFAKTTIQQSHTKSNEWGYESEYRLVKIRYPESLTEKDRKQNIPNSFFAEIIIGLKTPLKTREELKELGKIKNMRIFQAVKVPFKYEIDREEIF